MITNLPKKRISVTTEYQIFLGVLPTRWRRKPAGVDTERNYVIVTLLFIFIYLFIIITP